MARPKTVMELLTRKEKEFIKKKLKIKKIDDAKIEILKQLKERIKQIKDIRMQHKIIYKQWDILMCAILASLAQNDTWDEIHEFVTDNYKWFKSFLQMTGGILSAQTYERVLSMINSDELNSILFNFFESITFNTVINEPKFYNIDGRTNNGSNRKETFMNNKVTEPLNCLNVYSSEHKYCIYTKQIKDKSNEIPAVEELIKGLNLKDIIVTWDALNTQLDNINAVINAGGDYIVPIKANQGTFYQDLIDYFDDECCDKIIAGNLNSAYLKQNEKSHSSYIQYEYFETSDVNWYHRKDEWNGLKSIGMVKKTITKLVNKIVEVTRKGKKVKKKISKEETIVEKRFYISSRFVNIIEFEKAVREHWNIENKIHWHLDFTFCQDANRTMNKKALLNLEIIHKFVLGILTKVKINYNRSLKSIRKHLSNNFEEFFPELICVLLLH